MKIAILGARGLIGKMLLKLLEEEKVKKDQENEIECFGTQSSHVVFQSRTLPLQEIADFQPDKFDLIFSALNDNSTKKIEPMIKKSNAIWIDKSASLRMENDIPLIVPEVNGSLALEKKIIASPNCVAIPVAIFAKAVEKFELTMLNITTYQSVSGAGYKALDAFFKEVKAFNINPLKKGILYENPMAFNVIPAIGEIQTNGDCEEEKKIKQELHKILNNKEILITATTMRVSTTLSHLISLNFQLTQNVTAEQILNRLKKIGIIYSNNLVTPIMAAHEKSVFACRLREQAPNHWSIILICDNLQKGGALNAIEIAKLLAN